MVSMTFTAARRFALVPILLAGAIALWLSTAPAGHAVTATQTQSMQATVTSSLAFGTAGNCTQNTALVDFGSVAPGAASATGAGSPGTGTNLCITASVQPWSLSVVGTTPMSSNPMTTIPFSAVSVNLPSGGVIPAGGNQTVTSGSLGAAVTLVSFNPNTGTTKVGAGLLQYTLNVPAGQAPGSYTGGVVTYTATA